MSNIERRVDKLEARDGVKGPMLFVWPNEGQTEAEAQAEAIARYEAGGGKIGPGTEVIFFHWGAAAQ